MTDPRPVVPMGVQFTQDRGDWELISRQTEQQFRMRHPMNGFVTFTWVRRWGVFGGGTAGLVLLPSVRMFFYPDYVLDRTRGSSLVFSLGGHGIHDRSGTHEVIEKIKGLMAEGLWERAVERVDAEPDFTIDWAGSPEVSDGEDD